MGVLSVSTLLTPLTPLIPFQFSLGIIICD